MTGPVDGILRCVNVLCSNYGVMVEGIRTLRIGEWDISKIAEGLGWNRTGAMSAYGTVPELAKGWLAEARLR